MIKHGHRRQRADKKETNLAHTEQDMTQYNPVPESDFGLKTASIPIGRLHYHQAKHRDDKVLRRTDHYLSGSQFLVIRKRVPEKHLGSYNLRDYRAPEQTFGYGAVHCQLFQQLRTIESCYRKLKASDNPLWSSAFVSKWLKISATLGSRDRRCPPIESLTLICFQRWHRISLRRFSTLASPKFRA
jgi:hypothetical protein